MHVIIDAAVNSPETLGKFVTRAFTTATGDKIEGQKKALEWRMSKIKEDAIVNPCSVAEAYWWLYSQSRDCWTFELDMRPWNEKPYWSTAGNSAL